MSKIEKQFKDVVIDKESIKSFDMKILDLINNQSICRIGFSLTLKESVNNHKMTLSFDGDTCFTREAPKTNTSIDELIRGFSLDVIAMGFWGFIEESERLKK